MQKFTLREGEGLAVGDDSVEVVAIADGHVRLRFCDERHSRIGRKGHTFALGNATFLVDKFATRGRLNVVFAIDAAPELEVRALTRAHFTEVRLQAS